jgi:tRNA 5-methylaminomethyl-2-thiouridine biosynthesis bifunctional protein
LKTAPIEPAQLDWSGPVPRASGFDDVYHPRDGALAQARHVFLAGNALPERWRGRARFAILETGFGLGLNFLAAWQAWRDDPARCARLHFVSIEKHPPRLDDLVRAHAAAGAPAELAQALQRRWPPLTPNLHALDFDGQRVELLLAFGDVAEVLPALRCTADALFLDGFAPARNPAMWALPVLKAIGRRAAPGATAATWSVAREVREGLATAGFEVERMQGFGGKREMTVARFAPRRTRRVGSGPQEPPLARRGGAAATLEVGAAAATPEVGAAAGTPEVGCAEAAAAVGCADKAFVVGAGIAGACVARALRRQGFDVTVFDRHPAPAAEGSGQPGGLVHGTWHRADGPHARLLRAGALEAAQAYRALITAPPEAGPWAGPARADEGAAAVVPGALDGLLSIDRRAGSAQAMQAALRATGLPPEYLQALDAAAAGALAGVPLGAPAWFYPDGGWIAPGAAVRAALGGVRFVGGVEVARVEHGGAGGWRLRDAAGRLLGQAAVLVLANAAGAARLLQPLGHAPWPTALTRGQVSVLSPALARAAADAPPRAPGVPECRLVLPLTGDGYALPLPGGALLCGATRTPADGALDLRAADHLWNIERACRLTGLALPREPHCWTGRAGHRLHTLDRLPIAGAVARPGSAATQARSLERETGLFVVSALGARGLTLAPLLGRLVAAMAGGAPWPLEQDLVDAIDPGRWQVRVARRRA